MRGNGAKQILENTCNVYLDLMADKIRKNIAYNIFLH
jgi:hypothetical protein